MSIAEELEAHFVLKDYKWRIDGELQTPSVEDIEKALERVKELIAEGGSIEVGRLIVQKPLPEVDNYDVYVYVGSLGEES